MNQFEYGPDLYAWPVRCHQQDSHISVPACRTGPSETQTSRYVVVTTSSSDVGLFAFAGQSGTCQIQRPLQVDVFGPLFDRRAEFVARLRYQAESQVHVGQQRQ